MHSVRRALWIMSLISMLIGVGIAAGAEIHGVVRDYIDPKMGIGGVSVCLDHRCSPAKPSSTTTDANGVYSLNDVKPGQRSLYFDKVGYTLRNGSWTDLIKDEKNVVDYELMQDTPKMGNAYFHKAGEIYVGRVAKAGGKTEAYTAQWQYVRKFAMDPPNKIEMVRAILKKDDKASMMYPGFRQYQEVDMSKLMDVQERLASALETVSSEKLPTPTIAKNLRIGDELVADATLYLLRTSKAKDDAKAKFLDQFGQTWKGTEAFELVRQGYGKSPK